MATYASSNRGIGRLTGGRARAAAAAALAVCLAWAPAAANAEEALSAAETAAIEALIERYIAEHPEVILESVRAYSAREEERARADAQSRLVSMSDQIKFDPTDPVAGNPDGDVTVVEFFDYRCGYCKRSLDMVMALIREDPDVRVVFKELPILTPQSARAARAALASMKQGKYLDFHYALMAARGDLEDAQIMDIAAEVGLDLDRLVEDMKAPAIDAKLDANRELARLLNINGTPTFIVGDQALPGALDSETMRRVIADTRAG